MATERGNSPTISGHLGTIGIQDVMGFLATTNQGGALEIESPDGELTLYLEGDAVVGGQVTRGGVDAAALLLRRGHLGTDDLDAVREVTAHTDIYTALVDAGRIGTGDVADLVAEELSENLQRLFSWTPGEFRFYEGRTAASDVNPVRIEIRGLLFEAALCSTQWSALPSLYGDADTRFELRGEPLPGDNLALGLDHWKVLYLAANHRRLAEIWQESPLASNFETSRTLFGLASARLIQPAGSARSGDDAKRPPDVESPPRPPKLKRRRRATTSESLKTAGDPESDTQPVVTKEPDDLPPPRRGRLTRAQIHVERTPCLVRLGTGADEVYPLDGDQVTVGRSPESDLILPDPHVSSRHARIVRDAEAFEIEDCQSSNGLAVNGRKLPRSILRGGEVIEIFPYRFRFEVAFEISAVTTQARAT